MDLHAIVVQTKSAKLPQAGAAQTKPGTADATESKSFQQMVQEAAQAARDNEKLLQSGQTQKKPDVENAQQPTDESFVQQSGLPPEEVDPVLSELTVELDQTEGIDNKLNMLYALFGVGIGEIDTQQSDIEILKAVYHNSNDPEAKFAAMLLMAFLQANPDKTLDDVTQNIPENLLQNPDVSPVQKVMLGITRMMAADATVKSDPLLDQLLMTARAMQKTGEVPKTEPFEAYLLGNAKTGQPQPQPTTKTDNGSGELAAREEFRNAVAQAQKQLQSQLTTGKQRTTKTDVDQLQNQVDAGSFLRNTAQPLYYLQRAGAAQGNELFGVEAQELVNQVKTGLLTGMDSGKSEFVMKLRPEGLGELTVRLIDSGEKMTLQIIASNQQTQKVLSAEIANLQAAMKPLHVEVEPVQTSQQASGQLMSEQFASQQFGEHAHNGMSGERFQTQFAQEQQDDEESQPQGYPQSVGATALDTYI